MTTPLELVCDKLGIAIDAKMAKCPGHDDEKSSLSIKEGDDGRVLLHCHAGCSFEVILDALGLEAKDLFPEKAGAKSRLVATYPYHRANGELLFEVLRYEPKRFSVRRPDGHGGWIDNLDGVERVPFLLRELIVADPNTVVWIPEGEKHVDRLVKRGFVATTNFGGANEWRPAFNAYLADRHVVLLEDNDRPGRRRVLEIARSLAAVASSVKIVRFAESKKGADVSDFFEAGGTREKLIELAAAATVLTAQAADDLLKLEGLRELTAADVVAELEALDMSKDLDELVLDVAELAKLVPPLSGVEHAMLRERAMRLVHDRGVRAPARLVDAILGQAGSNNDDSKSGRRVLFEDLEPYGDVVDARDLLDGLVRGFATTSCCRRAAQRRSLSGCSSPTRSTTSMSVPTSRSPRRSRSAASRFSSIYSPP
jgi:hypothetical protein